MKIIHIASAGLNLAVIGIMAFVASKELHARELAEIERLQAEVAAQQQQISEKETHCLALNIYHEARHESVTAQRAVAWVTVNRVNDERFPSSICEVVHQSVKDKSGNPIRNKCQFSWYCDGASDEPKETESWESVQQIATDFYFNHGERVDPTEGATHYHANYVNPRWSRDFERTVRIDSHIFYR